MLAVTAMTVLHASAVMEESRHWQHLCFPGHTSPTTGHRSPTTGHTSPLDPTTAQQRSILLLLLFSIFGYPSQATLVLNVDVGFVLSYVAQQLAHRGQYLYLFAHLGGEASSNDRKTNLINL